MFQPICFLDLDGVLVDFTAAALQVHGRELPPREITWDFASQIGFTGERVAKFWEPLDYSFWRDLPWTAEGKQLLATVEEIFPPERICLLTTPCRTPGCAEGKLDWVRREIPGYADRVLVGSCKHLLASPRAVLVDDRDENARGFVLSGGWSLLVPRPWNIRARQTDQRGRCDVQQFRRDLRLIRVEMEDLASGAQSFRTAMMAPLPA